MQSKLNDDWRSTEYKTFDIDKYNISISEENDVIKKLNLINLKIERHPNKKDIDRLLVRNGKIVGALELESHKKYWKGIIFPFDTVHFLFRKKKFKNKKYYYLMYSEQLINCVLIDFEKLDDSFVKHIDNNQCKDELMYDVPVNLCVFGWDNCRDYLENNV